MKKTKVFISHASEDKPSAARPIYQALCKDYDVWFDEYELNVGDPLRAKIDDGLKKCDFGIVILSKDFFRKKWPQSELDGLLTLESSNRKLILPVWHGVGEEEVKAFSPILAGRYGASTAKGIDDVVNMLRRSMAASQRTLEVTAPSEGKSAILQAAKKISHREEQSNFFATEAGAFAVLQSAKSIVEKIASDVEATNSESGKALYVVRQKQDATLLMYAPCYLLLSTYISDLFLNSATKTKFYAGITKSDAFMQRAERSIALSEMDWSARLNTNGQIVWETEEIKELQTPELVADSILKRLADLIEEEMSSE